MPIHKGENPYIYGLHDKGGEHLLIVNGVAKGWVLVTEAIGTEAHERGGRDYRDITDKGLGLIVRINQSYGENGTIPREARYPEFVQRVANFVEDSKGANIWLIGNEMNYPREQPRRAGSNEAEPITPRRYAELYKMVRQKIKSISGHENDLVVTGAPAPWNPGTTYEADPRGKYPANPNGDWIIYFRDILLALGPENCDAISIHAYSHGYAPEMVFSEATMNPPFQNRYYNFFTYRDHMNAIPKNMQHLPVYLTEANGDKEPGMAGGPNQVTWPFGNNGWIKNAYKEINNWNKSGRQQIRCMILFRWQDDPLGWSISIKPGAQQDLGEAVAMDYKWDPTVSEKMEPKPEAEVVTTPPRPEPKPTAPGYRAKYLDHNTPTRVTAGETVTVNLTLQNVGSFEWLQGGSQPFRLGFLWYGPQGSIISLPPALDFRTPLPRNIKPGETVQLQARLRPPDQPGNYQLRWDMVHEMVTWFSSQGDAGLVIPVTVTAPTPRPEPVTPSTPVTIQAEDVSGTLPQNPAKAYPMRTHADIKRMILHHTATPPNITVERIAQFQVNDRGLPGITYHFCVTAEGKVYQTQYLETVANHAGEHSRDSVGVCLIGNFTSAPPPQAQLNAAATLLAQLCLQLGLTADQIVGYSEIERTQSPGATWSTWKAPLLNEVRRLISSGKPISAPEPAIEKPLEHFMLFYHRTPEDWAEWDLQGALDYVARFRPVIGFEIQQAKNAKYVTIVGGPGGVPANAERILRDAGCQVERINGGTEAETRQLLQRLAAEGKRFLNLK